MTVAEETTKRINRILKTDDLSVPVELKKVVILGEIAVLLAGLLDVKMAELGAKNETDS